MSMPVITLTPPSKAGISPPEITKNIRDASFSSYLDGAEETFVLKFEGTTTQSHNSTISTPHDHTFLVKNKAEEREIDVFDAEKYFNEGLNQSPAKVSPKKLPNHQHQLKKDDPPEIFAIKEQPPIATQSIRSESSWNSRSALLRNCHQPRKANKKNFLASISCNCSCADKNSVDIDDYSGDNCSIKSVNTGFVNGKTKNGDKIIRNSNSAKFDEKELKLNSQGNFSFPFFTSKSGKTQARDEQEAAAMRKSLEVFGSPILENRKNLTKLTWDAIAGEEININSSNEMNHDSDSDASSDLFEIESFSKGNLFLSRQTTDGLSGCRTPTTCYAPSEASIEWSVVTASAAEFSVLSDSEELESNPTTNTMTCTQKTGLNSKIPPFKEIPKIRSGILSGCRSHKAVRVAGDAHRANDHGFSSNSRKPLRIESFKGMTRFHDESKVSGFDSRNGRQSENAAHLLYI